MTQHTLTSRSSRPASTWSSSSSSSVWSSTTRPGTRSLNGWEAIVFVVVPDKQMHELVTTGVLTRHEFHGEWNYTLYTPRRRAC
jgi:hypothetical protein